MINLNNYYIHATGGYRGDFNSENTIIDILRDGKIKANGIRKNYELSPMNQVCLCDTTRPLVDGKELLSAYDDFVLYSPCLLFSKDLDVKIPEYDVYDSNRCWDLNKADMYDEVRYDGDLSLEKLQLITFPIKYEKKLCPAEQTELYFFIEELNIYKENIKIIEKDYKTIPIKDIYTSKNITTDDLNRQIYYCKKKMKVPYDTFKELYDK